LYQGDFSELDDDIGWNDFDLREYDPQIGRFTTPDPYDQFASGYVGMGNDPVNNIDPSGGSVFESIGADIVGGAAIGFISGLIYGAVTGNKSPLKTGAIGAGLGVAVFASIDFLKGAPQISVQGAGKVAEHVVSAAVNIYAQNAQNRESPFKDKNLPIGFRIPGIPFPILPVYQKEMPITFLHKLYTIIVLRKPIILTHKKGIARGNRDRLMKEPPNQQMYRDKDNIWRDEYPYASTEEGGPGASVWPVPASEQKIEREQLLQFYQQFLPNGGKFLVIPIPDFGDKKPVPEIKPAPDNIPLEILEKILQRFYRLYLSWTRILYRIRAKALNCLQDMPY
jgi:RHS repeat-associated protein